jgi:predicted nuclease with RNAse H fold
MSIVAIGWDVRGWRGTKQAIVVLKFEKHKEHPQWWVSDDFQFQPGQSFSLSSLVSRATGTEKQPWLEQADKIVVGIDAPLAFPRAFIDLLTNNKTSITPSSTEMENPLAYRDCERWIYKQFGKKPLSATFDKLGNGATLALSLAHALVQEGFQLVPQTANDAVRAIIEVYPAMHKIEPRRAAAAIEPIHRLIPTNVAVGTDQYDAAICSILAALHAGCEDYLGLPLVSDIHEGFDPAEGWIYALPADYVREYRD